MNIRYRIGSLLGHKAVVGKRSFLLTNRAGSFYYHNPKTRYGGWFVYDCGELYRTVADFMVSSAPIGMVHHLYSVEQEHEDFRERFFLPFGEPVLVYQTIPARTVELVLDVKKGYDNRQWGRVYTVTNDGSRTIIRFDKKTDSKEDKSSGQEEFSFFVVVNAVGKLIGSWDERQYSHDKRRNSPPFSRFVYRAVRFSAPQLVLSAGQHLQRAIDANTRVTGNFAELLGKQRNYAETFAGQSHNSLGACVAGYALDSLVQSGLVHSSAAQSQDIEQCMWAGLPWFFQEWSRDEAVSLRALTLLGETETAKKILFRQLRAVQNDGWLPNRYGAYPSQGLKSADAVGWLFVRFRDFMRMHSLETKEKKEVEERLVQAIDALHEHHTHEGFAWNEPLETWMDTVPPGAGMTRKNAAIEIQALRLAMYKLAFELTKNVFYKELGEKLHAKVREYFWNGRVLADGLGDFTIRPNIFLAAYAYPELLENEEWSTCFENVLPSLWLEWGGLASVDTRNTLFVSEHTGENTRSYHQGDSWFWINNYAALVMHRTDRKKFGKYVTQIFSASRNELLWSGCVGGAAEVSSAKKLRSQGCVSQAWSAASFIELEHELNPCDGLKLHDTK